MPSNSGIKGEFQKCVYKTYDLKKSVYCPNFEPATTCMQVSCSSNLVTFAVDFEGMLLQFSPFLSLQPATECKLITLTRIDKLKVGGR